jgi:hypothetical protein
VLLCKEGQGLPVLSAPQDEDGVTKFLQDGVPCHTSKVSMALLREQPFTVMDWPRNSLDLNPIEHVWSIMRARLKRDHTITSLPKPERVIKTVWVRDLPLSLFQKLAHSMPTRTKMCLENKGQMIKY